MNLIEATQHPQLFAPWFRDRGTWSAQFAFLAALFNLPMTPDQLALYRCHTGRQDPPTIAHSEAWLCCGRRGGKSFVMALVAIYLACFRSYRQHLQPGERATILVIAADRKQARVVFRYIGGLLRDVPSLSLLIERETAEGFDLTNGVTIEIATASTRTTRGYTLAACLADEIAHWPTNDDAADPDYAVLDAIRPAMVTIPGAMLICASSHYARRGAMWDAYKRCWAKDDAPLFWKATTREMNPGVPQATIDQALERDRASASAEWLAEFRSDIEEYISLEAIEQCIAKGVLERPPTRGLNYRAFVDPSGGSADAMTLAIGHQGEGGTVVIDLIRERRPPFSPEAVVHDFSSAMKAYGVSKVTGDRYGGEFCREPFRRQGITYELSPKTRSDLYLDLLPVLNSGTVDMIDSPRLVAQLVGLERRTSRGGRDLIDHGPGGHDDLANSLAGVAYLCRQRVFTAPEAICGRYSRFGTWNGADTPDDPNALPPPRYANGAQSVFDGKAYRRENGRW